MEKLQMHAPIRFLEEKIRSLSSELRMWKKQPSNTDSIETVINNEIKEIENGLSILNKYAKQK